VTGQSSRTIPITGEAFLERLESDVLSWDAGRRLPSERQLALSFGVSRPVVREALRGLQARGLITVHPGRGSFVKEVAATRGSAPVDVIVRRGDATVRDLVVARRMIESEVAALAAEHHTEVDAQRLSALLAAFTRTDDVEERASLDVGFHEGIAVASHNTVLMIMFGSIRDLVHGMVVRSLTDRVTQQAGLPLHQMVLDAILARDPEAARAAMTKHVMTAVEHYGADVERPLATVLRRRAEHQPEASELLRRTSLALADEARASESGATA
jgi:GntR family transcriptional repressor for pyruvate dehydrogenase complex